MNDMLLHQRLQARDHQLVNELFDIYGSALYGILYRIVKQEQQAEKVLQDTFHTVWEKADTYNPKKFTFFTWIMAIARQLAQEHSDRVQPDLTKADETVGRPLLPELEKEGLATQKKLIEDLVAKLLPEEREVIHSVVLAGRNHAETARRLEVSVETVKKRLRTALFTLRKELSTTP